MKVEEVAELIDRLEHFKYHYYWLKRQVFGSTSERRLLDALTLGDQLYLGEVLDPGEEPPPRTTTVAEHERKQRKNPTTIVDSDSKLKFDSTVPVQVIEVPNLDLVGVPESELELIETRSTYRLAQTRGPYVVLKYEQKVYKRRDTGKVTCPPIPPAVYEKSPADVSFLANMIIDKFRYHLPLYRQHQRLEQSGIFLDRSTLTKLIHRTGELLEPIYHTLLASILGGQVLSIDETPTPAGRAKGKMKSGYFWVLYGDKSEVSFVFSPTRARSVLDQLLTGFEGTLMSDGYSAYHSYIRDTVNVVHAQCWAHVRRKFFEAERLEPDECGKMLAWIQQLYQIERHCKDPSTLAKMRETHSTRVVEHLFAFLRNEMDRTALLPSSPYVKAAEYTLARQRELSVFLVNPAVPIDNNHVERSLRPQAVGRKNWLFNVTEEGARCAAIFYTLIQSCVIAEVDPCTYLTDILQRVSIHPAVDVHLLTPREWKKHYSADPLRSDLR